MKKRIFVVLLVTMLVLTACDGAQDKGGTKERQGESNSLEDADSRDDSASQGKAGSGDLKPFATDATIEETVLVDENGVRIVATGLEYGNNMVNLNLLIENNSGQDLSFVSGSLGYSCNSVNGYMVEEGYLNVDVTAGSKANETVGFSMDGLSLYGITEVADIQIGFSISDSDYNHSYSGPRQVRTSIADTHDYSVDTYKEMVGGSIVSYDMLNPGARGLVDISLVSLLDAPIREAVGIDEIGNVSFFAVLSDDEANEICTSEEIQVEFSKDTATFDGSGEEVYNENGVRIIFKDLINVDGGWGKEVHLLLLAENGGKKKISVSDVSDITEASISLEIEDENYNTIAEPKVKIELGQ